LKPSNPHNPLTIEILQQKLAETEQILSDCRKKMRRMEFSVKRMRQDKDITENFLNATIEDLEEANEQLKIYQQKELAEKERTILSKENQLQQITDAMPFSMAFVDKDFKYQLNNKTYQTWFGKSLSSLKGQPISTIIAANKMGKVKELLEKVFAGQSISSEQIHSDKNNDDIILQINYIPAFDLHNTIIGAYVYAQDITQLKENKKAIEEKNAELERYIQSNLQLENFAYLASHDLRSPLNNVLNFTRLLTMTAKDKLDENELKFLEFINEGSKKMQQFIEDLLAYSLSSNKEITFSEINPLNLIQETLTDISSTLNKNDSSVIVGELPDTILGDRILLKQLFQNLISNANKFILEDRQPKITINCSVVNKNYLFSIKDNGIGIDDSSKEFIFGIFKRLHLRTEYDGTGIGLSTCKNAVEKHGGKIWVESTVGEGSTFYFTLPKSHKAR
jgi:PAS domain S-box-containing protein